MIPLKFIFRHFAFKMAKYKHKIMKKTQLLILLSACLLASCGKGNKTNESYNNTPSGDPTIPQGNPDQPDGPITPIVSISISLNKTTASLASGKTLQLTATVNGTTKLPTWSVTSGSGVVSVSSSGLVTGLSKGQATVTATVEGKSASCNITVVDPLDVVDATAVAVEKTSIEIELSKTYQIHASILPEDATFKEISYKSWDTSVCTVSETGLITPVALGKTDVRAESIGTPGIYKDIHVEIIEDSVSLPSSTSRGYTKVTSGSLVDGKAVEFISQTRGLIYGMGENEKSSDGNNHKGFECSVSNNTIVENGSVGEYIVVKNSDNTYSFRNTFGKYLNASGGLNNNYLKVSDTLTKTCKFRVSISNGLASIVCADDDTSRNTLMLNNNGGNPVFSCYSPVISEDFTQVTFYQKDAITKVEIDDILEVVSQPEYIERGGTIDLNQVVLLCSTKSGGTTTAHPDDYWLGSESNGYIDVTYWIGDDCWIDTTIRII